MRGQIEVEAAGKILGKEGQRLKSQTQEDKTKLAVHKNNPALS
jgi:hypothetical protein